jgi:hypothetical protein
MNTSFMQLSLVGLNEDDLAPLCRSKPQLSLVCPHKEGSDPSVTVNYAMNLINASIFTALMGG